MATVLVELVDTSTLKGNLGPVGFLSDIRDPSSEFFGGSTAMSPDERQALIRQAKVMLDEVYVHRSLKRERRATDPVAALRQLERRAKDGRLASDLEFHTAMQTIFKSLKDIHTTYIAPPPYATAIAFLPFTVESYFEDPQGNGPRHFVVADVAEGLDHPRFERGIEITHWNGAPIEAIIRRLGDSDEGSNSAAGFALGQKFLTVRWLGVSPPPIDDWVDLTVSHGGERAYLRLPWLLLKLEGDGNRFEIALQAIWALEKEIFPESESGQQMRTEPAPSMANAAHNQRTLVEHSVRKLVFAPGKHREQVNKRSTNTLILQQMKAKEDDAGVLQDASATRESDRSSRPGRVEEPVDIESHIPEVFEARAIPVAGELLGYIRIRHFRYRVETSDDVGFAREFERLLALVPKRALILDIRGNPGGWVECAERILQFLTPGEITPLPFQFPATPLIETITELDSGAGSLPADAESFVKFRERFTRKWREQVRQATSTGALYTAGLALTAKEAANATGQRYFGPVTLIVDAITYSSGDIFAASFQDHGIGKVVGVDEYTGGGGANVWSHSLLQMLAKGHRFLDGALAGLPGKAQFSFAARRCVRVHRAAGTPIEEIAVHPDVRHWTTKDDLFKGSADLIERAAGILLQEPLRTFEPKALRDGDVVRIEIHSSGIDRVHVFANGAPAGPALSPKAPGQFKYAFAAPIDQPQRIELCGYEDPTNRLVARFKQKLSPIS